MSLILESCLVALKSQASVSLLAATGAVSVRTGILSTEATAAASKLVLFVLFPALALSRARHGT